MNLTYSYSYYRPDGRTFRSKQDIKQYMFVKALDHDLELFDFRLGEDFYIRQGLAVPFRARNNRPPIAAAIKKEPLDLPVTSPTPLMEVPQSITPSVPVAPVVEQMYAPIPQPKLSIVKTEPVAGPSAAEPDVPAFVPEEDGYRCPLEDCRKLFRRDNLLVVNNNFM